MEGGEEVGLGEMGYGVQYLNGVSINCLIIVVVRKFEVSLLLCHLISTDRHFAWQAKSCLLHNKGDVCE